MRRQQRREEKPENRYDRPERHRNSWIDSSVADSHPTLQTHDPRAGRTEISAAASAPPNCDAEPWAEARSRSPRRQGRRWGGDRLRRPHARERPVLPDEDWAARTLWDVENDDENDRTYLFDAGPMDHQCGYCQAF